MGGDYLINKRGRAMRTVPSVEDRKRLRTDREHTPQQAGYRVIPASDGAETRIRVCESHPDLILPDLVLPAGISYREYLVAC
jgi:DNA-binding response OmpR family regulator